ncbi:MAG: phosphopyruvate hydratase [Patescibacteria group bacterium]|nr:phosphopyruvate hydratase [Patescibacteria group bacterium]
MKIKKITAYEILDSRGNPTVRVKLTTENGALASANVPSGASTGEHEALELRDNDPARFNGKGVLQAIKNIKEKIAPELIGMEITDQEKIDQKMIQLDGTANKTNLGANSTLGVSLAIARAMAEEKHLPLYKYLAQLNGSAEEEIVFPNPMCNVINGGAHADSGMDIQEYMLVATGIDSVQEKVRALSEIYHALKTRLKKDKYTIAVGDEGGFAPRLKSNAEPLEYLTVATEEAGYKVGKDINFALDVAASEFYDPQSQKYILKLDEKELSAEELISYYEELIAKYPIIIIEDGLAEDDIEGWKLFNQKCGEKISIMGDDFTVTNKQRLNWALENKALNSILIKPNQIGTLTETLECIKISQEQGLKIAISHRSGDTRDDFIADLAVGVGADWLKSGSMARSERVSKYNRLLEIKNEEAN